MHKELTKGATKPEILRICSFKDKYIIILEVNMKTVVWGNYKGGVGKTTSVFQVATRFAFKGKRVLLIDLDPQCSLSHICCTSNGDSLSDYAPEKTFNYLVELYMRYIQDSCRFDYELLKGDITSIIDNIVRKSTVKLRRREFKDNLFFIPSSLSFENCRMNELAQRMERNIFNLFIIQLFLNDLAEFDYVFFDCPPTTNLMIQGAFLSSDFYIVPTIIDKISSQGVSDYIAEIEKTWTKFNMNNNVGAILIQKIFKKKAKLIGIFETIYKDRRGNADNSPEVKQLDAMISRIPNIVSLLSNSRYAEYRYSDKEDGFSTFNIFREYISHRDNRSGGESIPLSTGSGESTPSYIELSDQILEMLEQK